ncbi:MAG: GNAT family N-acetyltransferase [Pseudomonadota bacterium]
MITEIFTNRLLLRHFERSDADFDRTMATDPDVMEHLGGVLSREQIDRDLVDFRRRGGDGSIGVWTLIERATSAPVGSLFLTPMPIEAEDTEWDTIEPGKWPEGPVEIGYQLQKSAWGAGFATEACRGLLKHAFDTTPLSEIFGVFEDGHDASERVLIKCGFVKQDPMRAYAEDLPAYRVTKERFLIHMAGFNDAAR